MTIHDGSEDIVSFVAKLVNDPTLDTYDGMDIMAALTKYAIEARYLPLDKHPTYASGGAATYKVFTVPPACGWGYFETTTAFVDGSYTTATPNIFDYVNGRFEYTVEPTNTPIRLVGWSHDPYAAAADLLEMRAAQLAEDMDSFAVFNGSFAMGQRRQGPLALAKTYRMKSRRFNGVHTLTRSDVTAWQA